MKGFQFKLSFDLEDLAWEGYPKGYRVNHNIRIVKWVSPPNGLLICNIDGASKGEGKKSNLRGRNLASLSEIDVFSVEDLDTKYHEIRKERKNQPKWPSLALDLTLSSSYLIKRFISSGVQFVLLMFEVPRRGSPRFVTRAYGRNWFLHLSDDDITLEVQGSHYI
ncbi:hypothetical protein HAX54_008539 [Datura stramonium]|uniref:Uncharacterized protein n=1 Tax=Datura stramonium TaxID=4076 RepID=A0ABS8TDE0_DATST|nr:hypothetical protein [Datura stramonium]